MLVSVIVNNYNYAQYLDEAIKSVLEQTYPNIEIIVVDDGSTDNSKEIIQSYEKYLKPIFKKNGGQASAINEGIKVSKGDIIAFLDADDKWMPEKIESIVNVLKNIPCNWSFLRHDLKLFRDMSDNKIDNQTILNLDLKSNFECHRIKAEDLLIKRLNVPTSAMVVAKKSLDLLGPIPEKEFRISADAYLYTNLPRYGKVITLNQVLGYYRIHGTNNFFGTWKSIEGKEKTLKLEFDLLKELPDNVRYNDIILRFSHDLKKQNDQYLKELGDFNTRIQRIIGDNPLNMLDLKTLKMVLKEIRRSLVSMIK